jgi:hypothetical protein
MPSANLNEPGSLESIYPRDAFLRDSARNGNAADPVRHGVRVTSAPDANGAFEMTVASQQTGERDPGGDSVFLAPERSQAASGTPEGSPDGVSQDGYAAFLKAVMEAVRTARFKRPVGKDRRLAGFHGG